MESKILYFRLILYILIYLDNSDTIYIWVNVNEAIAYIPMYVKVIPLFGIDI